jgi:hypothetical protein
MRFHTRGSYLRLMASLAVATTLLLPGQVSAASSCDGTACQAMPGKPLELKAFIHDPSPAKPVVEGVKKRAGETHKNLRSDQSLRSRRATRALPHRVEKPAADEIRKGLVLDIAGPESQRDTAGAAVPNVTVVAADDLNELDRKLAQELSASPVISPVRPPHVDDSKDAWLIRIWSGLRNTLDALALAVYRLTGVPWGTWKPASLSPPSG